jgi:PRTRC genetic system protein B
MFCSESRKEKMKMANNDNGRAPVPGFVFPEIEPEDEGEYASLQMRLDLYEDVILATRYEAGTPGATYAVDPDDLALALADLSLSSKFLPPNCLFWGKSGGAERLAVYLPPQVWPVSVQGEKETWRVPLPGLVFEGKGTNYRIYAVKRRPDTPAEPLYLAPVPNMSGSICTGNAPFPVAGAGTIMPAVAAFFESGFNTHLSNGKSRKHPTGVLAMWRELREAGAEAYPPDDLVEARMTVANMMEGK